MSGTSDPDLLDAVARFVGAFEEMFENDWDYSRWCFAEIHNFVEAEGTFLRPLVDDEVDDWGCRAEVLEKYRELRAVMRRAGLDPIKAYT